MAKNADRPWVRDHVRKELRPVKEVLASIVDTLEDLEERIAALEEGSAPNPPDPEPPHPGLDELPVGGWSVIENLEQSHPADWDISREYGSAYFVFYPHWNYKQPLPSWPVVDGVEGNCWVICQYGNKWYMSTYEWLRPFQTEKRAVTKGNIADHTKKWQLQGWVPEPGDTLYFFNTTVARNGTSVDFPQRTNVIKVVVS